MNRITHYFKSLLLIELWQGLILTMRLIRHIEDVPFDAHGAVVALGNFDGVHLGQQDLTVAEAREILGPDKIIGISTHSQDQFLAALDTSADYIAIGPIYPTTTKENPSPVVGLDLLRDAKSIADRPLVAIGGINHARAKEVLAAGADSLAVISALYPWPEVLDLTSKPDIVGSVRAFLEVVTQ